MARRDRVILDPEIDASGKLARSHVRFSYRIGRRCTPKASPRHLGGWRVQHTFIGEKIAGDLSLSLDDRLRHVAVIGATGSGKSTLLRQMARQDIARGDGLLLLDPHGDLAEAVLGDVPAVRGNHVCYLNCADADWPVGLNVLEDTARDDRARAVDGVVAAMRAIWHDSWGPRLELILRHACSVLIELPNASLLHLPRLLTDDAFRKEAVARVANHEARAFFGTRFEKWRDAFRDEAIDPVLNKVEEFLAFPQLKNILGQSPSTLDLSYAMQHRRIVIANLATGTVGETPARLFGALLLAHLRAATMARASIPASERRPFHLYIDEAHSFGPAAIARLLSETRKYALSIVLVTQFLDALSNETRSALLGNAKTLIAFRCAPADAVVLAPTFNRLHEQFNVNSLLELEDGQAMVSAPNHPPGRVSIPPPAPLGSPERVINQSRRHYARRRAEVERFIARQLGYTAATSEH